MDPAAGDEPRLAADGWPSFDDPQNDAFGDIPLESVETNECDDWGQDLSDDSIDRGQFGFARDADPISPTTSSVTPSSPTSEGRSPSPKSPKHMAQSATVRVEMPESTLLIPRSCYEPFEPGVPVMSEGEAVKLLLSSEERDDHSDFVDFELDDFAVYCDAPHYPLEMRSLSDLATKLGHSRFFFNGILTAGETKVYVRGVPIAALPIDNYGTLMEHTVRDHIWIQSKLNSRREIYYRLGCPAKEYARFFKPFLWVADLAKHFVDFLNTMEDNDRKVTIHSFRATFRSWLVRAHRDSPEFTEWLGQHPSYDFRTSVVANLPFLHKESIGVLGGRSTYYHTIWAEIWEFNLYKPVPATSANPNPPTIVTQYIYDCFEHMPFGDRLQPLAASEDTRRLRDKLIRDRRLELPSPLHNAVKHVSKAPQHRIQNINPGDTISTHRDDADSGTTWKREMSRGDDDVDRWFALVQDVRITKKGRRVFDVLWYYRPVDTLCGLMKYPWRNELFLSDHCSCAERAKIDEDEVQGVHEVDFGGNSTTAAEFFCRQAYTHGERRWVTLREEHKRCEHRQIETNAGEYSPGDTLLVQLTSRNPLSEPCELLSFTGKKSKTVFELRRLPARKTVDANSPHAPQNELVYSRQVVRARRHQIQGSCHVRFFKHDEKIPTPYDRDGVGCCFYITHAEEEGDGDHAQRYTPLEFFPASLRQGFDPRPEIPKLRGLDLFCGGGNFGRGLEDGGGVEMGWANDYDAKAIHTYMANAQPGAVAPFLGSIDDLQRLAIEGRFSAAVPSIGDVDFISGGSPCPGFSHLTNDKTTLPQRKNQSLVAAFASAVDLYRPRYAILENVTGIVQKRAANRDQDVFSQLVCALVGLGYQAQLFFLDACGCGSPQRRSRVFVVAAAPNHAFPRRPPQSHDHPPGTKRLGLGMLPNGLPMAERDVAGPAPPFPPVEAARAVADLPPVTDAKPDICVPFPDHRISLGLTAQLRSKIRLIPTRPWGMNFALAWYGPERKRAGSGVMTAAERAGFPGGDQGSSSRSDLRGRPFSNAYGRLHPRRRLETVVTRQSPGDAKQGRQLHWREPRVMTIMEARRAQGFRDEEVLLGGPAAQYKVVGNSVAREVAVALGVEFREAWVQTLRARGGGGGGNGLAAEDGIVPVAVDEETTEPSSDEDADDAPDAQPRPSHHGTPSTTLSLGSSRATPSRGSARPSTSQEPAEPASRKRPLQSTLSAEPFSSKLRKLKH